MVLGEGGTRENADEGDYQIEEKSWEFHKNAKMQDTGYKIHVEHVLVSRFIGAASLFPNRLGFRKAQPEFGKTS